MEKKYQKLNSVRFAIAGGIVIAILFLFTTLAGIFNYCPECTDLITGIYGPFGYSVSLMGALIIAAYGFIDGFVITWIFAFIYNKLI